MELNSTVLNQSSPQSAKGKRKKPTQATTRGKLYRKIDIIELPNSGIEVQYKKPSFQQRGALYYFIIESALPFLFTDEEAATMKREELHQKVLKLFLEKITESKEEEGNGLIAMMLLDQKTKPYLYEAIRDCFPGLEPSELTDEAYVDIFAHFSQYLTENLLTIKESIEQE